MNKVKRWINLSGKYGSLCTVSLLVARTATERTSPIQLLRERTDMVHCFSVNAAHQKTLTQACLFKSQMLERQQQNQI